MDLSATNLIVFGPFELDRANARLLRDGAPVAVTPKALDVLHYLASRPDKLVTKDELLGAVWPDVVVSDASIKVCVREIRSALADDVKTPRYIETVHRRGYRFVGYKAAPATSSLSTTATETAPAGSTSKPDVDTASLIAAPVALASGNPLVGRESQLRDLFDALARAQRGLRQCIFVTGNLGTGKTAVVEAFIEQVNLAQRNHRKSDHPPLVLLGHCFEQFAAAEPYMPLWEAITQAAREEPSDLTMAHLLERHAAARQSLATALTPAAAHGPVEYVNTSDRMLRELADTLEALAAHAPLVLVLEDVHWADYSTLDLISALCRRRGPAKLMILATFRPAEVASNDDHPLREIVQGLLANRLASEIGLDLLDADAVKAYLAARFPDNAFPSALATRLQQRTDGHPLFLVHLVNDLVEQGVLAEQDGRWRLVSADEAGEEGAWVAVLDTHIPETARAMVEMHVDRLPAEHQHALEAAAVAGMEFSAAAVAAPLKCDVVQAEALCEELARRHHFLEPRGLAEWPDGTIATHYRFVHDLYHNVVYERLPVARRVRMHQALAERLESAWTDRTTEEAAALAVHFEHGRDWARALRYLRMAADAAGRQYAHREGVQYLHRAEDAIEHLPESSPDRREHELPVLVALAVNLQITRGCAAPEVEELFARAERLARRGQSKDVHAIFPVLWGIWVFQKVRSDLRRADQMAQHLLEMANESGDASLLLQAHQSMCVTALCLGNPRVTVDHMKQAAMIYDPSIHPCNTQRFGQDPGVATLAFGAVAQLLIGEENESLRTSERALAQARKVKQPSTLSLALFFAAMLHQMRGDAAATERFAQETIDFATDMGLSFWLAGGRVLRGWSWSARGGGDVGIAEMGRGLEAWLRTGSRTYQPYYLGLLADGLLRLKQQREALTMLDEALAASRALPEGLYEAQLWRLKGRALAATDPNQSQQCEQQAVSIARRQHAAWFETPR